MKGGEKKMQTFANDQLRLVQAIRAEQMEQAASASVREAPPNIRRAIRHADRPVRRRLAGEPTYGLGPIAMSGSGWRPHPETPMLTLNHELRASYAFIERNFFLTRRYWAGTGVPGLLRRGRAQHLAHRSRSGSPR